MLLRDLSESRKKACYYLERYVDILKLQISSIEKGDIDSLVLQTKAAGESISYTASYKKTADALWKDLTGCQIIESDTDFREQQLFSADFERLASESSRLNRVCSDKLRKLMEKHTSRLESVKQTLSGIDKTAAHDVDIHPPQMLDISI